MNFSRTLSLYIFTWLILFWALPLKAHEFWIEPQDYTIEVGETMVADVRNGQLFSGNSYTYIPRDYSKFSFTIEGQTEDLEATIGQKPAMLFPVNRSGLGILVAETNGDKVSYVDWAKFQKFVDHKDLGVSEDDHLSAGFPPEGFKETYRRFTKALVGVGSAIGQDQTVGMEIELVALANPYTDDTSNGLPVKGFYQGEPLKNVQIELFEKNQDEEVVVTLHRTNDSGIALLPIKSGYSYLVDTVQLRKASASDDETVVWETLWAALTFAKP